jgi:hypothetical protein
MNYSDFQTKLNNYTKTEKLEVLNKIGEEPARFIGDYRFTNAKNKLIQFLSQSQEIKFGRFLEDIFRDWFTEYGAVYDDTMSGSQDHDLMFDQFFFINNYAVLIEQKIRDDHDSAKKRGQVDNFKKKERYLKKVLNDKYIFVSCMWFIDDSMQKNKNYYLNELGSDKLFYGNELVGFLKRLDQSQNWTLIWEQFFSFLTTYKEQHHIDNFNFNIGQSYDLLDFSFLSNKSIKNLLIHFKKLKDFLFLFLDEQDPYEFFMFALQNRRKNQTIRECYKLLSLYREEHGN